MFSSLVCFAGCCPLWKRCHGLKIMKIQCVEGGMGSPFPAGRTCCTSPRQRPDPFRSRHCSRWNTLWSCRTPGHLSQSTARVEEDMKHLNQHFGSWLVIASAFEMHWLRIKSRFVFCRYINKVGHIKFLCSARNIFGEGAEQLATKT